MKILVTGGHLTPALALVKYALAQGDECVFVGRQFAQVSTKQPSHERAEVEQLGINFIPFSSGKVAHTNLLSGLEQLTQFWQAVGEAGKILRTEKPDVFVSFGGYLAVPVAIAAKLQKIPIVTHEQTRTSGMANRFIGWLANRVAVTYPETVQFFPATKTVVTGNPLRDELFSNTPKLPTWLKKPSKPVLYVTGGSQGSHAINTVVRELLPTLLQDWTVIHQCGEPSKAVNDLATLTKFRDELSTELQSRYAVQTWLSADDLAWVYRHTKVVIARSGANTVSELTSTATPAIFIPLPNAREDEQYKNALAVVEAGAGLILPQSELTAARLLATIQEFNDNYAILKAKAEAYQTQIEVHADQKLYELVKAVVS